MTKHLIFFEKNLFFLFNLDARPNLSSRTFSMDMTQTNKYTVVKLVSTRKNSNHKQILVSKVIEEYMKYEKCV